MNIINNIIRNATISNTAKNIVIAPYDGIFELSLCQNTIHNLYALPSLQKLLQPTVSHERLMSLSQNIQDWHIGLDIDLIICNSITSQINECNAISKMLHVPLLIIHHGLMPHFVKLEDLQILSTENAHHPIVSISSIINHSWYSDFPVLPYYVPIDNDTNHEDKILIIGNFDRHHVGFLQEIQKQSNIPVTVIGNNPGISQNTTLDECIKLFKTHKTFINLYNDLELNPMMLYAMGAGCNIITTPSTINSSVIENGVNGHIITSVSEIFDKIIPKTKTGHQAQKTVETMFNNKAFSDRWTKLIDDVSKKPFLG